MVKCCQVLVFPNIVILQETAHGLVRYLLPLGFFSTSGHDLVLQ